MKIHPPLLAGVLVAAVFSATFAIHTVRANTITVPDDFPTIQEAINAASDANTILARANMRNTKETPKD